MKNEKWISVKDRLPKEFTLVLMASNVKDEDWVVAGELKKKKWFNQFEDERDACPCHPSHWMPIPKAPK